VNQGAPLSIIIGFRRHTHKRGSCTKAKQPPRVCNLRPPQNLTALYLERWKLDRRSIQLHAPPEKHFYLAPWILLWVIKGPVLFLPRTIQAQWAVLYNQSLTILGNSLNGNFTALPPLLCLGLNRSEINWIASEMEYIV